MPLTITGVPSGYGSTTGSINPVHDTDPFNGYLRGGEIYEFRAIGSSGLDPILTMHRYGAPIAVPNPNVGPDTSTQGGVVRNDDANGTLNSRLHFRPMTCGNYSLVVSGFNTSTGNYTVSAREVQGSISTYSRIPTPNPGQTVQRTGDLHANGDQDYHRITLTAGHLYRFNLNSRNFGCGALADPYLEIRNSNGARVPLSAGGPGTTGQGGFVQDDDSGPGLNSQLSFRPTTSGTYYVNARAYNNASTGGYNISVSRQPMFHQPMIA